MKRFALFLVAGLIGASLGLGAPSRPALSQNLFAPVVQINGRTITRYEIEQRILFLELLRAPGNLEEEAEKALINERVQVLAAQAAGIQPTPEEMAEGMAEFASRANLETEAFLQAIGERGVAPETFESFILAGIMWRNYVQSRFSRQATVTDADVERALAAASFESGARVQVAELVLPVDPTREAQSLDLINRLQARGQTAEAFSNAARQFSISNTRLNGGLRDWVSLADIPPSLAQQLLTLAPGEITDPVPLAENVVGIFQLRGVSEIGPNPVANLELDYLTVPLAGGDTPENRAEVARLSTGADSCGEVYPLLRAKGTQDSATRETGNPRSMPRDLTLAMADLDAGETTTVLRNNGTVLMFVMLCGRAPVLEDDEARARLRIGIINQRLTALADGHLQELLADAFISRP